MGRIERWHHQLERMERFVADHDRLPSRETRTAGVERELGNWLDYQRRWVGRLSDAQVTALEALAGWRSGNHDERWDSHLTQVTVFAVREGHWPRRRSENAGERTLAEWVRRQQRATDAGALRYDRLVDWQRVRVLIEREFEARNRNHDHI